MHYNGVELTKYLKITKGFTTLTGADFATDIQNFDNSDGGYFRSNKINSKKITVPVFLEYKDTKGYDEIQKALNVNQPKKLIFSDMPFRYYNAVPTGDLNFTKLAQYGQGTITFIVPDGLAHSTSYRTFNNFTETDGKVVFDVINNGNVYALPIITAKMNSENGYFGITGNDGFIQIGDKEIVNSETLAYSERPFDYSDTGTKIADGFAKGAKNVAILNDELQTLDKQLAITSDWNRDHLYLPNPTAPSGNHAGSLTWDLPTEGSLYDNIWWRQIFWAWNVNQLGFIKISISDTDGNFLFGVETIKRKTGVETEYNILVADGNGGYKFTDVRKKFNATHKNENPFNQGRGWMEIKRIDDKLNIHWNGSHFERIIPELKGKKSAKLHVAIGSMNGRPLVRKMYLDGIRYRKDNVADGYNIPNAYGQNSEVVINCENKTFWVDNVAKLNHVDQHSKWLKLPPGKSTVEINTSSWNEIKPNFTIEFEERWL